MLAAQTGNEEIVRRLVDYGADPTAKVTNLCVSDFKCHFFGF